MSAMVRALCGRSVHVPCARDGSCRTRVWEVENERVAPWSVSGPGIANQTERGMRGIATIIEDGVGR
jgi:hypothetical protein